MRVRTDCPGCGDTAGTTPWILARQPVVLNYRFGDAESASHVPRRPMALVQCKGCGLVFNAVFDGSAIPYDGSYENRQSFSPAFGRYLERIAAGMVQRNGLKRGRILEVGCGKGDFLRLICGLADARGEGYDTSYEPRSEPEGSRVSFHRRYVGPSDITSPFDAILCRHVVEHVPEIGAFLRELAAIARAAGDPVVILETPRFEWIVSDSGLWDVFYEHCNYFPSPTLAHLCRLAGFRVVRHRGEFGMQYQLLELKLARTRRIAKPPGIPRDARLAAFARRSVRHLRALGDRIARAAGRRGWAVWGAGAKGVALVNHLARPKPRFVVDSNPAKQGGVLPGTRIPIVAPGDPAIADLGLVVIANPNYLAEIRVQLGDGGFRGTILTL